MLRWMAFGILFVLVFTAILTGASGQSIDEAPLNKTAQPSLESVLYQLAQSSDPSEFASSRNIYIKDDRVRVIIELKNQTDVISEKFNITIESSDKNLVQALVKITDLIELANEPYVKYIRTPLKPQAVADKTGIKTANSDSFFLSLLGTISIFFLLRKNSRGKQ